MAPRRARLLRSAAFLRCRCFTFIFYSSLSLSLSLYFSVVPFSDFLCFTRVCVCSLIGRHFFFAPSFHHAFSFSFIRDVRVSFSFRFLLVVFFSFIFVGGCCGGWRFALVAAQRGHRRSFTSTIVRSARIALELPSFIYIYIYILLFFLSYRVFFARAHRTGRRVANLVAILDWFFFNFLAFPTHSFPIFRHFFGVAFFFSPSLGQVEPKKKHKQRRRVDAIDDHFRITTFCRRWCFYFSLPGCVGYISLAFRCIFFCVCVCVCVFAGAAGSSTDGPAVRWRR